MCSEVVSALLQDLPVRFSEKDERLFEQFAAIYFAHVPSEIVEKISLTDRQGMLVTHFALLKSYQAKAPAIRVFNPEIESDYLASDHTVIEIIARDRPFLVDTLVMALDEMGLTMHRLVHSIVHLERDEKGELLAIGAVEDSHESHVSVMYCEIEAQAQESLAAIAEKLREKISLLDVVVGDWGAMRAKLAEVTAALDDTALAQAAYPADEVKGFLHWILDNHFTFLGAREYRFSEDAQGRKQCMRVGGSGLGVLREAGVDKPASSFMELPAELQAQVAAPQVLFFSKSDRQSPVHRSVYMDMLAVQRFDAQGKVIGEVRFLGLLTASAYQLTPDCIPLLRDKVNAVLAKAHLPKDGHAYKKMRNILNYMPRDDLFQADVEALYPIAQGILHLQDRQQLRLFVRVDYYQRFVSCLVYIPREKFSTSMRLKMQDILMKSFDGMAVEFDTRFSDAHHARVHVHVRTRQGHIKPFDVQEIEQRLTAAMRDWQDVFQDALHQNLGAQASVVAHEFSQAIPAAYRESVNPRHAVADIQRLQLLRAQEPLALHLFQSAGEASDHLHLKVYGLGETPSLTFLLPKLEHFGVLVNTARPFHFTPQSGKKLWMQQFDLALSHQESVNMAVVQEQFEEAFLRVCRGEVESDSLNELVLTTTLNIDEVIVLRALARYMIQARAPFSVDYIQQTLVNNAPIAEALIAHFSARMSPDASHRDEAGDTAAKIEALLQQVNSLDEDRILRWYLVLINAMLRTNFYQRNPDGSRKNRLSFKFDSQAIPELPKPRPMVEIFVYSPRVEAIHLRGGKVARGGLRWSDRMEDFRTEVLGLVKAQMVKNAVIVPVGSKGGFVVKTPTEGREAFMAEGIECYKTFIRGLLDITDNIVSGSIVPPENTVRHDGDDPYLVVAADKGTATFSDIANGISKDYGFWLGDAFASGGSVGYDHKAMGITAKGAWESVKRHFRMMGKDIQHEDFTVLGIGDMSGDVFGNGMLCSPHIRLLAAFNHLHIFIDPNPDTQRAFAERERLFGLPRSSWADYDQSLLSQGGGIFARSEKSIAITPEMKAVFDIQEDKLTPTELINRLLKAPVELIWNGGIGTYIKHSAETNLDVGDRANDGLRVNGCEVRAKVIGEGGNLGVTQRGRIEYAQHGGRLYTDAIDNSAGVNCSDHEVNIKILLNEVVSQGDMTEKQRNELLASMTDSVAELVLRQNYLQPQAIENAVADTSLLSEHARLIRALEAEGRLDRAIEYLPDDAEINARLKAGKGLTRPEIAVLLAYSKMWLYEQLLAGALPDDPYFSQELARYFPAALGEKYQKEMHQHRLHREIIATYLTNSLVNRMGATFIQRMMDNSGRDAATVASSYTIAREIFHARCYWQAISALDNQVSANLQIELETELRRLLERATQWLLYHLDNPNEVAENIQRFSRVMEVLEAKTEDSQEVAARAQTLQAQGIEQATAEILAKLRDATAALDIVLLAEQHAERDISEIILCYENLRTRLGGAEIVRSIRHLPRGDYWVRRAAVALENRLSQTLHRLVHQQLNNHESLTEWEDNHRETLGLYDQMRREISEDAPNNLAMLSVLLGEIDSL